MRRLLPRRKVVAGAIGAAGPGVIVVWAFGLVGIEVPPEVAVEIAALVGGAFAYFVPERRADA